MRTYLKAYQWLTYSPPVGRDTYGEGDVLRYVCTMEEGGELCPDCRLEMHLHGVLFPTRMDRVMEVVCPGDWVLTDTEGSTHVCKPDIFETTYELVGVNK